MRRRRIRRIKVGRRQVLAGLLALSAAAPVATRALADALLDGADLGLVPDAGVDQTEALRAALAAAVRAGRPLFLSAGEYVVSDLPIPGSVTVIGVQGRTYLIAGGPGPAARITGSSDVALEGLGFAPGDSGPRGDDGLLNIDGSAHIALNRCRFIDSRGNGLSARGSAVVVDQCDFSGHAGAGIFSLDGNGLLVTNTLVSDCGNGGILIWGSSNRRDGSILIGNVISNIRADAGGNGQNGNGINVFRADRVIISDNQISDCAFTAVRLNSTNNTQVRGNTCINSGEVAIFSEFAFSGSVIADNIVDGAATGISITNFDTGGRLATCSGNIVRNIAPRSLVNPDTRPIGIYVEAETTVTGNSLDGVPGIGIAAGFGPFLRNVLIADNIFYGVHTGIGVSVVDNPSPGPVKISDNLIFDPLDHGIVGLAWTEVVSDDLVRDAAKYPHVSLAGNTIGRLS